jgi:hypothetical protein
MSDPVRVKIVDVKIPLTSVMVLVIKFSFCLALWAALMAGLAFIVITLLGNALAPIFANL